MSAIAMLLSQNDEKTIIRLKNLDSLDMLHGSICLLVECFLLSFKILCL